MGDYQKLTVWQRAHELTVTLYRSTSSFPDRERYGLTSQVRKAAISIVSNIAEGASRGSDKELVRFLYIAHSSSCEVECQLLLAKDLGFIRKDSWLRLDTECRQIGKMLNGLIRNLKKRNS